MNTKFKEALDAGHLEIATLADGTPFVRNDEAGKPVRFYWATESGVNMYAGRFHAIQDLLRTHDVLKLTAETVDTAFTAMEELCTTAVMCVQTNPRQAADAMTDVKTIMSRLKMRRQMSLDLEQLFDLAGAWFFTENENPLILDMGHLAWKKQLFMRYMELHDFFLRMPFSRFVPWTALLDETILNCSREQTLLERMDWKLLQLKYGASGQSPAMTSTLQSRMATLESYDSLLNQLSNPTTTT